MKTKIPKIYIDDKDERDSHQKDINDKLEKFRDSCSGEERKRQDALKRAVEILEENDVPFTAFFHTTHPDSLGKVSAIPYNNYENTMNRRESSMEEVSILNCQFANTIIGMIRSWGSVNKIPDSVSLNETMALWAEVHLKGHKRHRESIETDGAN